MTITAPGSITTTSDAVNFLRAVTLAFYQTNGPRSQVFVGLDNFLYAYRGRYILDAAWQEPNLNHPHNIVLDFATRLPGVDPRRLALLGWSMGGALVPRAAAFDARIKLLIPNPGVLNWGQAKFDQFNQRLATFYKAEYEKAQQLERVGPGAHEVAHHGEGHVRQRQRHLLAAAGQAPVPLGSVSPMQCPLVMM